MERIWTGSPEEQASFRHLEDAFRGVGDTAEPWTDTQAGSKHANITRMRFRVKSTSPVLFQKNLICGEVLDRCFKSDVAEDSPERWEGRPAIPARDYRKMVHKEYESLAQSFPTREEAMAYVDSVLRDEGWVLP